MPGAVLPSLSAPPSTAFLCMPQYETRLRSPICAFHLFRCSSPEELLGLPLANLTSEMFRDDDSTSSRRSMIAAAIAIPVIVLCLLVIFFIVLRMVQNRKQMRRAQVRYSAVYRDTVESSVPAQKNMYRPTSEI